MDNSSCKNISEGIEKRERNLIPWQPGQSGNPFGRPKSSRNKLGEAFLEALHNDFKEHGVTAIAEAREESPLGYVRVCASLLPSEVQIKNTSTFDDMSLDELRKFTESLRSVISGAGAIVTGGSAGEEKETGRLSPIH